MIEYKFSLEMTENGIQKSIHAKSSECESRKVIITLTEKRKIIDLSDYKVRAYFSDGTYTDDVDIVNNTVELIIPAGLLVSAGDKDCELKLYNGLKTIYSPFFRIIVEGSYEGSAADEARKKVSLQEATETLPEMTDPIADDDSIPVYDESKGKSFRLLWSKIKSLFGSAADVDANKNDIQSLKKAAKTADESIVELKESTDAVNKNIEGISDNIKTLQAKSHSHANNDVLNALGKSENKLTFNGKLIGGVQPDFRESDSTADTFIRNKTHYEYGKTIEIPEGAEYIDFPEPEFYRFDDIRFRVVKAVKVCDALEDISFLSQLYGEDITYEDYKGEECLYALNTLIDVEYLNVSEFNAMVYSETDRKWTDVVTPILHVHEMLAYVAEEFQFSYYNEEKLDDEGNMTIVTRTVPAGLYFYDLTTKYSGNTEGTKTTKLFVREKLQQIPERFIKPKEIKSASFVNDYYDCSIMEYLMPGCVDFIVSAAKLPKGKNIIPVKIDINYYSDSWVSFDDLVASGEMPANCYIELFPAPAVRNESLGWDDMLLVARYHDIDKDNPSQFYINSSDNTIIRGCILYYLEV